MGIVNERGCVISHMFAQNVTDKERSDWFHYVSASRTGGEADTALVVRPIEG